MAHFYGKIQSNGGEATRTGSKASGIVASAGGWTVGGEIRVYFDEATGGDVAEIYATSGSSARGERVLVAVVRLGENGKINVERKG
jgi:hypothetical protein